MKTKLQFIIAILIIVFSFISYAQVVKIGHRGCASLAPENTYSSWTKAIEVGADYFELDIQLSSDDSMMIMHDNTVDRTTNGTGLVSSLTYTQLKALDAGSWFSPEFAGEQVPAFSEALDLAKTDGNINVVAEIKTTDAGIVPMVVAMIQAYGLQDRVIISSFNYAQIFQSHSLDSTIAVQLFASPMTNPLIEQVSSMGGEWVGAGGTITQSLIDYAHTNGLLFNGWTIDNASDMLFLIGMGIDGITTNYPQVLVAISDSSAPSDVIINSAISTGETNITLDWQPAIDPQSGITNYEIYRDVNPNPTTLLVTVGDITNYVDLTQIANQTFYYRMKAINGNGLKSVNYSNEVSATSGMDTTKPVVSYITSEGDTSTVYIEFNEEVEELSSETLTNYMIDQNVVVNSAELGLDLKTVKLTTTYLADASYTIIVKNVKDRATIPNTMETDSLDFTHTNITADVVAFYRLDNVEVAGSDTLVIDSSPNGNDGVVMNGATISDGYLGNAMEFDGVDDFVQFENSPSFDISGSEVTVSVWTKLVYLPISLPMAYGPLFDSEQDRYVLYEDKGNNELRFKVTTSGGAERPGIPGVDLITGEWINVVGVYDGTSAKIYLNGEEKDSHSISGTISSGQVPMLGKSGTSGTPSYFEGSIDNVLILNRALSSEEVMDIYTKTKVPIVVSVDNEEIKNPIPVSYSLEQNYPNPFNPSTTIRFKIPMTGFVSLKVYDILGSEVATLVNEEKSIGSYKVNFNAASLASGIYFYRLQVNEFVDVKKMILLR